jgi:hypothetical protein
MTREFRTEHYLKEGIPMPANAFIRRTEIAIAIAFAAGVAAISLAVGHAGTHHDSAGFGWDAPVGVTAAAQTPVALDGFGWD